MTANPPDRIVIAINDSETAHKIVELSQELGIERSAVVALAIRGRLPK